MKDKVLFGSIFIVLFLLLFGSIYLLKEKIQKNLKQASPQSNPFFSKNKPFNPFSGFLKFGPEFNRLENEKEYVIKGYMPDIQGMIKINIENDSLIISGEQKTKNEEKKGNFYRMESSFSSFSRTIPIPNNVKISDIKTEYNNGYLIIILPKSTQSNRFKQL